MEACDAACVPSLDFDNIRLCKTIRRQMSSVLAMAVACKLRLSSGPDSSRLVLQSLLPTSSVSAGLTEGSGFKSSSDSDNEISTRNFDKFGGRRYSAAQSNEAGETGEIPGARDNTSDQLIHMFTSTLYSSSSSSAFGKDPSQNLASVAEGSVVGAEASGGGLRRQGSSPVLSSLAHHTGSLVHGYLQRRASSSALYTLTESSKRISVIPPPSADVGRTAGGAVQKANTSSTCEPQTVDSAPHAGACVDSNDASSAKTKGGFGLVKSTRRFGAWLGKVTHGDKVEVTKKDLNVFAPTSF